MPPIVPTAGAQVRIRGRLHGQLTVNVLNFATETPWNVDTISVDLTALAQAVLDCLVQTLLPVVTSNWTLEGVDAISIYPEKGHQVTVLPQAAAVGAKSAVSTSVESFLVNIRTGAGGRRGLGRAFFPPPGEAEIANSIIDAPTLVLMLQFLACLSGKFMGANPTTAWRLGVLSRTDMAGILGNFPNSFRQAVTLEPSNVVAVMGTRKLGRGA